MSKEEVNIVKLYHNMTQAEKLSFNKYITVQTRVTVNPDFAKSLINPIDGCTVCGCAWDTIQRLRRPV